MANAKTQLTTTDGTSPVNRTPVVSLVQLPREIRDAIYHQVWLDTPNIYFSDPSLGNLLYGHHTPGSIGLPHWLLTNKSTFHEGLQQLFKHVPWLCRRKINLNNPKACPPIATLFATKLHLGAKKEIGSREMPAIHYGDIVAPALTPELLARFGHQLRHVSLYFDQNLPGSVHAQVWRLDLACLDGVGRRLDSFAVVCNATRRGEFDRDGLAPGLVEAYEMETRRVGGKLVGADAVVRVEVDVEVSGCWSGRGVETRAHIRVACHTKRV